MKKFGWVVHVVILAVIAFICLGPWILVATAAEVASANGCQLDEGSVHPCVINGKDYGDTLYGMGLMGWIGIATLPLALILLGVYLLLVIVLWLVKRNKEKQAA
jgi:TRAP-type C4-dicarboxylate transport system permease small subunit